MIVVFVGKLKILMLRVAYGKQRIYLFGFIVIKKIKGIKKLLHYVAVNARTKETMGSVPIHMPKLLGISALVELLGILLMMFVDSDYSFLFLLLGFIYFLVMYLKYRNTNARHHYETETKSNMQNLRKKDEFIRRETGLSNSKINGANNTSATAAEYY